MEFTAEQRKYLAQMVASHQQPPSWIKLLTPAVVYALVSLTLTVGVLTLCDSLRTPFFALMIGATAGIFGNMLGAIWTWKRRWPVYEAVIDWQLAKELAESSMPSDPKRAKC